MHLWKLDPLERNSCPLVLLSSSSVRYLSVLKSINSSLRSAYVQPNPCLYLCPCRPFVLVHSKYLLTHLPACCGRVLAWDSAFCSFILLSIHRLCLRFGPVCFVCSFVCLPSSPLHSICSVFVFVWSWSWILLSCFVAESGIVSVRVSIKVVVGAGCWVFTPSVRSLLCI